MYSRNERINRGQGADKYIIYTAVSVQEREGDRVIILSGSSMNVWVWVCIMLSNHVSSWIPTYQQPSLPWQQEELAHHPPPPNYTHLSYPFY